MFHIRVLGLGLVVNTFAGDGLIRSLIFAIQTGCSGPGCKFNDKGTDVLLTLEIKCG
jgi:hypothetical protein